eukprot:SAG11_NODE_772_length_7254_cov_1.857582_10_plen_314_part_00
MALRSFAASRAEERAEPEAMGAGAVGEEGSAQKLRSIEAVKLRQQMARSFGAARGLAPQPIGQSSAEERLAVAVPAAESAAAGGGSASLCSLLVLTVPMLGIGYAWAIQYARIPAYLEEMGMNDALMSASFAAGPVSGAIMQVSDSSVFEGQHIPLWDRAKLSSWLPTLVLAVGIAAALSESARDWPIGGPHPLWAQPIVGALSDRTTHRLGRRRPWMLGGAAVRARPRPAPPHPGRACVLNHEGDGLWLHAQMLGSAYLLLSNAYTLGGWLGDGARPEAEAEPKTTGGLRVWGCVIATFAFWCEGPRRWSEP